MRLWPHRRQSLLGQQISGTLPPGMDLPEPLELLFSWIEENRLYVDASGGRIGYLFPEAEMKAGWTKLGRPGGTYIEFAAESAVNRYWFEKDNAEIRSRLCVFCRTGGDGSIGALWLDDDGNQRIVHLGSGSGSTLVCVLADNAVDFLRLLAIGYDEICWGDFADPPSANREFVVAPNQAFADWVIATFETTVPERGAQIVKYPAMMEDEDSPDPFWNWVEATDLLN